MEIKITLVQDDKIFDNRHGKPAAALIEFSNGDTEVTVRQYSFKPSDIANNISVAIGKELNKLKFDEVFQKLYDFII